VATPGWESATGKDSPDTGVTILARKWCNIFGGENDGGAKAVLGGIGPQSPSTQWYCPTRSIGRYVMTCYHGHKGQIMHLCGKHLAEFRTAVTFCPACNTNPPGHKCRLKMEELS
jgi:hypothetical protein